MKRLIFIFTVVLCFVFSGGAFAQRQLPDMQGIQVTGGMVDGFHSKDNRNELGYYFGLSMTTYAKSGNKWVFGGEYLQKSYQYKTKLIPTAQFTVEGGYYYNFLSDPSKTVFFSVGASAMAGYETVNWGESLFPKAFCLLLPLIMT